MATEENTQDRIVRGQLCGYHNGWPVYYSRPHFIVGNNKKFVRFLSQKEAKRFGLTEDANKNSAKIYNQHGYIGPDRHRGKGEVKQ